jgi:hypothetical protein
MNKKVLAYLRGMGSILVLAPEAPKPMKHPGKRTVAESIEGDWNKVGSDMLRGLEAAKAKSQPVIWVDSR